MIPQDLPEHFRLFTALTIPETVKDRLEAVQRTLRRGLPDGSVRWTRREQFHLTLKFMGNVEASQLETLQRSMEPCGEFAPLKLRAEKVGFFPSERAPRVVWTGISDAEGDLERLQAAVERTISPFTSEEPEERFSGHVTLGRVKNLRWPDAQILRQAAAAFESVVLGDWVADEIEIVRSQLTPEGSSYSLVGKIALRGGTR